MHRIHLPSRVMLLMHVILDLVSTFCFSFLEIDVFLILLILSDLVSLALLCPITSTVVHIAIAYNSKLSFGDPFPKMMVSIMRIYWPSVSVISFLISISSCWFYYHAANPLKSAGQTFIKKKVKYLINGIRCFKLESQKRN
ncbi:uncharacterized protein EV154DRAFT_554396 [Mucor mucedo]|uniref:uncharacterized protein n=1 Tax=Mucor mucedo TaxID=29922 RepID=UPI002220D71A|nr:uncharacterized protein EV154DRAFT_554396 [Mucor mucedo]KAI7887686.1 hypothetical protein EV154DRAFT_554396 [Mucor mucedo]